MSLLEDFQEAAVELFNTFESVIVNANYCQETSDYVPGGNTSITTTRYPVRLLKDSGRATLTLQSVGSVAEDVTFNSVKYLLITAELPVVPKVKDKIEIGSVMKVILAVESDPGDVVSILYVG